MESDIFRTIVAPSQGQYKEKGSKFLAFAYPVLSQDEVAFYLDDLKQKYYDARHIPFAYRLGHSDNCYRSNDDGEPSNTAGKPILGQIDSFQLTNVCISVVRYFGGVKLGVGGLINAFRTAAHEALINAQIEERTINNNIEVRFQYAHMNDVMRIIKDDNLNIKTQDFQLTCKIILSVRESHTQKILRKFAQFYDIETSLVS